ncbi:MAG: hypothetical protein EXR84_00970 [Gammaproteobacteria bacterium]|nr:hypothetical protein [Gammaproteobacteria bacterium]
MKEQKWDDTAGSTKEFIEATAIIADDDAEERISVAPDKTRVTELRRRIEERMDSKRIERQFEYDLDRDIEFDLKEEPSDNLQ